MTASLAGRLVAAVARLGALTPVVLIDGPSGAGKSTLADALLARWPTDASPQLLRLDELYPGWDGLAAGSAQLAGLLAELRRRGIARWRGWDWAAGRPGGRHDLTADRPLIVEGCGALSRASARHAELRVWLTADDRARKARALARDRGAFDAHWQMWDEQFTAFVRAQHPLALADLVLDGTPESARPWLRASPTRYIHDMSTAESSKTYVTEFVDGPLQGTTENRSYIEGDYERELDMYVAVEGLPSQLHYVAQSTRQIGDTLFVSYRFDSADSDSIEVDDQDTNI